MSLDPTASTFTPAADPSTSTIPASNPPASNHTHDTPLFSPTLLSPTVLSRLPPTYTLRPLLRTDFSLGFLDVLRVLTSVGDVSESAFQARYDLMARTPETYYVLVVCNGEGRIVGTGALVVERKFIHGLGCVGHIEDIAVARDQQGMKLGLRIMEAVVSLGERLGCYKVSEVTCV